jgi:CubicO group peptidase (beta-lactamase class C family)
MRLVIPFALIALLGSAQSSVSQRLDQIATAELTRQHIPGLAVVAVRDGRVVYSKGFGATSADSKNPVTADTVFRVGSMTKMLVATAAMSLADQGRLRLDAPVGNYVYGLDAQVGQVTSHQLLSHMSGLRDEAFSFGPHDEEALGRAISSWNRSMFFTEPGKVYSYSNPGYALMGRVIEVIRGAPFADVMDQMVLQPLGMKSSTFRPTMAMTFPLAVGHNADGTVSRPMPDYVPNWPAGFLFSTAGDFGRFVIAFLSDGKLDDRQIFPASVFSALAQPRAQIPGRYGTQYGYGLYIEQDKGFPVLAHGGTIQGYTSAVVMAPSFKTGVVVMANRDGADTSGIADMLLAALLPVRFSAVVPPPPATGVDLSKFTGKYANGASSLEIRTSDGKLSAKTGDEAVPLEPAGADCFTGAFTVCFADGYANMGGRAYRRK